MKLRRDAHAVDLGDVRYFFIDGAEGGYVVVPRGFPPAATAHVIAVRAELQPAPRAEPLAADGERGAWRDVSLRVAMAPARNGDEAAALAPRLGAA